MARGRDERRDEPRDELPVRIDLDLGDGCGRSGGGEVRPDEVPQAVEDRSPLVDTDGGVLPLSGSNMAGVFAWLGSSPAPTGAMPCLSRFFLVSRSATGP